MGIHILLTTIVTRLIYGKRKKNNGKMLRACILLDNRNPETHTC